jgi:hypothetical protein
MQVPSAPRAPRDELLERIIDLIGGVNLPISLVDKEPFRAFLRTAVRMEDLPTRSEIRQGIVQRAERMRSTIRPTIFAEYINLMIDGASSAHRIWL